MRAFVSLSMLLCVGACASLPNRDPLVVDVAGIESLPGEGMEIRLQVALRPAPPDPNQKTETTTDPDVKDPDKETVR